MLCSCFQWPASGPARVFSTLAPPMADNVLVSRQYYCNTTWHFSAASNIRAKKHPICRVRKKTPVANSLRLSLEPTEATTLALTRLQQYGAGEHCNVVHTRTTTSDLIDTGLGTLGRFTLDPCLGVWRCALEYLRM